MADHAPGEGKYFASAIEGTVEVEAFERAEDARASMWGQARRKVMLSFRETFLNDADLDRALDQFVASVREAARR